MANLYLRPVENQVRLLDAKPAVAVCIVPDEVYLNCRPKSYVAVPSDEVRTADERRMLKSAIDDRRRGQSRMGFLETPSHLEQYGLSPDFRRQLKARIMPCDIPVQIVRESTLDVTDQVRKGEKGTNPLSDRLWNLGTALSTSADESPGKPSGRGTGYATSVSPTVAMAVISERPAAPLRCSLTAATASSSWVSLDPGTPKKDMSFTFGPMPRNDFLRGTIETYQQQDGRPLREVFLHARSGIDPAEFEGFKNACPPGVKLVGIRVRKDRTGPRLFRHDEHPEPTRRGKHPVLRGTFWQRTRRHGLLFTTGFKPRIATYDGWEIPVPLSITVQHGDADLLQVAKDILGLTKLNYNACQLGESQPITVKYSDRIGEILLANPEVPRESWRHNFKFYI